MSKEETPPIIRWLHRYIFRGAGLVFLAGLITNLYLVWRVWARVFLAAVLLPAISLLQRSCQGRAHM